MTVSPASGIQYPVSSIAMNIEIIERCRLKRGGMLRGTYAEIRGSRMKVYAGAWAFYVPGLGAKILHSFQGSCHCIHATAPGRREVFEGTARLHDRRYSLDEWHRAYYTDVSRRAAENYVAARRLHDCGLGPAVAGCVAVPSFESFYAAGASHSFGILVEDLRRYPRRRPVTLAQLESAGVAPDRTASCIRQQIRGYVSDLNSVVGVTPVDAEAEVLAVQYQLERACNRC